jgi:hypothetical protein
MMSKKIHAEQSKEPYIDPIDHFIFYRGAGNPSSFGLSSRQEGSPGSFTLTNRCGEAIPRIFALQVSGGQSSWLAIDELLPVEYKDGKVRNQKGFTFQAPAGTTLEVAGELRERVVDTLRSEGLTLAEAKAMVATWDDLWFTEPGTRLLAILPQSVADAMVPLQICPVPTKIERVFVARVELITRAQEQVLTSILNPGTDQDADTAAARLSGLQLGRYAAGGMERATAIVREQMRGRFGELIRRSEEQQQVQAGADADAPVSIGVLSEAP